MLMLDALTEKVQPKPETLAPALARKLKAVGKKLMKDGQPISDPQIEESETARLAQEFVTTTLPRYKSLGVWE